MTSNPEELGECGGQLGRYRLLAELGHGGMAEVYLAEMRGPARFHKLVVIKQIRAELAEDPEFLGMFLDEARLAARLSHPNVVQTNEVGDEDGRYFMAMEFLDGQPLSRVRHRLGRGEALPLAMHIRILADVLAGLHHAHELADFDGTPLGVVHRDVTPPNIFITYDGVVKVVDFGIAKAKNSAAETKAGVVKGKVSYMAPEQAKGDPPVDRRADVFAVGVLLWEAATGGRLWKGMPELSILKHLFAGEIPSPRTVDPNIDPVLCTIIEKAMAPDREDRYPTAAAMQAVLEDYLQTRSDEIPRPEIGRRIAEAFKADRQRMRAIIDEQLAMPTIESVAMPLPVLDPPTASEIFTVGTRPPAPTTAHPPAPTTGRPPPTTARPPASIMGRHEIADPETPSPSRLTLSVLSTHDVPPRKDATHLKPVMLGGATLLAAAALFLALWLPSKTPAPGAEAAAPPPVATAAPASVRLSLSVVPPGATLLLDGKPLGASPVSTSFARDGELHELRIDAPGFVTRKEIITFDRDRVMEVALLPEPVPTSDPGNAAPAPRFHGAAQPAQNTSPLGAPPKGKPKRPIDDVNPYAP
ncbi:MAG: serine/threonine-protein kinase [Byssovorax sp.]